MIYLTKTEQGFRLVDPVTEIEIVITEDVLSILAEFIQAERGFSTNLIGTSWAPAPPPEPEAESATPDETIGVDETITVETTTKKNEEAYFVAYRSKQSNDAERFELDGVTLPDGTYYVTLETR